MYDSVTEVQTIELYFLGIFSAVLQPKTFEIEMSCFEFVILTPGILLKIT